MVNRLGERSGNTPIRAVNGASAAAAIQLGSVHTLEVNRGRGDRGASAVRGSLTGGMARAAFGFNVGDDRSANEWRCFDRGSIAAGFGGTGYWTGVASLLAGGGER